MRFFQVTPSPNSFAGKNLQGSAAGVYGCGVKLIIFLKLYLFIFFLNGGCSIAQHNVNAG